MSDIDFKVDNYSIGDLLEIFGIEEALPQNEIIERGSGLIEKYRQQNKSLYVNFFSKATNKLLSNYRKVEEYFGNISDSEDEQEGYVEGFVGSRSPDKSNLETKYVVNLGKKLPHMLPAENMWQHNQYQTGTTHQQLSDYTMPRRTDSTHVPTNLNHSVQLRKKLMLPNAYSQVPFSQGTMNPTLQNTYLTWVNIDSQFRDITTTTRQSTSYDINIEEQVVPGSIQQGSATDFIFTLNEPINNVLGMSLGSLELPLRGYYVFSKSKGNTTFDINFTWGDIGYLENNLDITKRLDTYIVASTDQIAIKTIELGLAGCSAAPKSATGHHKAVNCCKPIDPGEPTLVIPPYTGPFCGYPEKDEQLIEIFGNFGSFTSYSEVKTLHVPKIAGQFHCAQIPQGNYQNSTTSSAVPIEDYLTLAIQGIVGPQTLPTQPTISNIWTPNTNDNSSNITFIKSFISKGSGRPFFSLNGSFDWWINGTQPLCVPTATFLHTPGIGMTPPGFGAGWWNKTLNDTTLGDMFGVGTEWLLGTPTPCGAKDIFKALTPREIWGRVGRQYSGMNAFGVNAAPPSNLGFNLLDLDIFGRFIYYWNEIVCNWAHTNVYDLFVLGPTRWKKGIFVAKGVEPLQRPTSDTLFVEWQPNAALVDVEENEDAITGSNRCYTNKRLPWVFAEGSPWEAQNYIDQLPLTFEQFLKMQPGYETLWIASKSGGVGFWNVSHQDMSGEHHDQPLPRPPLIATMQRDGATEDPASTTTLNAWPFILERPIDPSGWQNGLDSRTTEGYWHNKDNFTPRDHAWEQICTDKGGWFGIGGQIPYPATTYVRGCPDISMRDSSSCVQKCKGIKSVGADGSEQILHGGGIRDDAHFPYPYGPANYSAGSGVGGGTPPSTTIPGVLTPWCCSTAGSGIYAADPSLVQICSPAGKLDCDLASFAHQTRDVSGTLSHVFAYCQGTTWQGACSGATTDASSVYCSRPHGTTGGIWCAQSAVGSGLYGSPQTDLSQNVAPVVDVSRSQWSNGLIPPFALNQVQTYVLYYIDKVLIPMAAENREQIWNANHYPAKMPPDLLTLMIKTTRQWLWLGGVRQQAFTETTKQYPFPLILPWPFPFCQGFPNYIYPPTNWIGSSKGLSQASLTRPFTLTSPGFLPHLPRFDLQWYNPCDPYGGLCSPPTCANPDGASQNKTYSGRKQNGNLGWNLGFKDFISKSSVYSFEDGFANGTYPEGFVEYSILQTGEYVMTKDAPTPPLKFQFDLSSAPFEFSDTESPYFASDGSGTINFGGGTITQILDSSHCTTDPSCNFPPNSTWLPYADISGQEWTIKGAPPWIYLQLIYCMTQEEKEEFNNERIKNAKLYGVTASWEWEKGASGWSIVEKTEILGETFALMAPGQGPDNIITNGINPSPWAWAFWSACAATEPAHLYPGWKKECSRRGQQMVACRVCGLPPSTGPGSPTGGCWQLWDISSGSLDGGTLERDISQCCTPAVKLQESESPPYKAMGSCQSACGPSGCWTKEGLADPSGHVFAATGVKEGYGPSPWTAAWNLLGVCPRYCSKTGLFESGGPPWPWAWPADLPSPYTFNSSKDYWRNNMAAPSPHQDKQFLKPWSDAWIERCYVPGWTYYKLCPTTNSTRGTVCMTSTIKWKCDVSMNDCSGCPPLCKDASGHPINFPLKIPAEYSNFVSQLVPLYATEVGIVTGQSNNQTASANCNAIWMGVTSNCVVNLNGTNYITLMIDEFNKNRFVGNMPGLSQPRSLQQFKTPSYAHRTKNSFPICPTPPICCPSGNSIVQKPSRITIQENQQGIQRIKRKCRKGTQNPNDIIDGSNNITQAQQYTALQIANHQAQKQINQYLPPALSNVLIRLPLERWQMSQGGQLVLMPPYNTSSGGRGMGRRYYGPITIRRLHIKIVDDLGFPLDLTCGNVSFSLLLERLYQY